MPARVHRTWVVGVVTCADVVALQSKVNTYRTAIEDALDALPADAKGNTGPHGMPAWMGLRERCNLFEEETCTLGLFAGGQHDRGAALISELDGWRDWIAATNEIVKQKGGTPAPLPDPVAVPKSDVSWLGEAENIGMMALVAFGLYVWSQHR